MTGRRWVVLGMLLALHAVLVSEPGGVFQRLWLLVHFGLFLIWQPFFAAEQELDVFSVVLLLAITAAMLYFVSGWMVVMWLLLLIGILGGRVFTVQAEQRSRFYLVAFAYVLTVMLLWAMPVLVLEGAQMPESVARFARNFLPVGLLALAFMPFPEADESGQVFDFFYAVLVFQLGLVLVLGAVGLMRFTADDYVASVVLTVLGFGLALFVLAILWNPMRGFGGLRTYFSRYLMSVGMPFELWMRRIAELAQTEPDPQRFLEQALEEIARFPWMRGGHWRSPEGEGRFGIEGAHATRFEHHGLVVVFHTAIPLSPALFLHMRLLAQVVSEFHEGKRRESALRQHAYLQAVHETGARLTHDVKNLLQSIYALTSVAPKQPADGFDEMLQRQLPQLAKRLHATLEKLRSPEVATREIPVRAAMWWSDVERRFGGGGLALEAAIAEDILVPAALFDGFLENTIENARAKRLRDRAVLVTVKFRVAPGRVELEVCDTGPPVPEAAVPRLFREPVERGAGLGIGLYNVARLAAQAGYRAELAANQDGEVRFLLRRVERAGSGGGER